MANSSEPPKKKRKLPSLDDSFSGSSRPSDSPSLHQGRKRTQPHVAGQWAAHIYLDLELEPTLRRTIKQALRSIEASASCTEELHLLVGSDAISSEAHQDTESSLHISLSRPLYLQTNQRAQLRASVAKVAASFKGFLARYATFGMLENDEKSRRFLAIEIGQGYEELQGIVRKLNVELEAMRLPPYYDTPRFHTSIAWTSVSSEDDAKSLPFQPSHLSELDKDYGKRLRQDELWVGELVLKIGKDVTKFQLSGR
ncbi:hypothetical protein JCM3765_004787 [Sporobolomyces pararoseus]